MKSKNVNQLLFQTASLFMLVLTSSILYGQGSKSTGLSEFELVVERTETTINLTCITGCAWKTLSYNLTMYKPVSIDEYGMSTLNQTSIEKNSDLPDFLFNVVVTENTIQLEGIEGLAWKDLSFSLRVNNKKAFGQNGMN